MLTFFSRLSSESALAAAFAAPPLAAGIQGSKKPEPRGPGFFCRPPEEVDRFVLVGHIDHHGSGVCFAAAGAGHCDGFDARFGGRGNLDAHG